MRERLQEIKERCEKATFELGNALMLYKDASWLISEAERLEGALKEAKVALSFYADKKNYETKESDVFSEIDGDKGRVARKTLSINGEELDGGL